MIEKLKMNHTTTFILFNLILCICCSNIAYTQDNNPDLSKVKTKKLIQIGDKLMANGSNYNAQDYYKAALIKTKKEKKQSYLTYQLGEANFLMRDYRQAQKYFEKTINTDKKGKYPKTLLQLANTYKHQGKYLEAKNTYKSFLDKNSSLDEEKSKARLEIKGCNYADTLTNDSLYISVENAGDKINGPFSDFGPTVHNNQLYHSKISSNEAISLDKTQLSDDQYARIYLSSKKIESIINEGNTYNGNPSFSSDGNTLYFTKCTLINGTQNLCAIYSSTYKNGEWQNPQKLNNEVNKEGINTTQPHITTDTEGNETLFFVAENRANGRGGKDIWFATKNEDGTFDKAKNLGDPINTKYDDLSPYYDNSTNTLYFSSNGHISIGGLDIFSIQKDEDQDWTEVVNMGTPINSSYDDYDYILSQNSNTQYLVSNRIGTTPFKSETCCDDIFIVKAISQELYISGIIYEDNTQKISPLSKLYLIDTENNTIIDSVHFKGKEYLFELERNKEYKITAQNINFKPVEININTENINKNDTLYQDIVLTERIERQDPLLGMIHYEYNKTKLREDAPITLFKVLDYMLSNPDAVIEIKAHTDSKGTDDYNVELSKRRSEAALNFLVSQGVNPDNLKLEWAGENEPIAPNTNKDGTDNPEGRALNRRTEFNILKTN